MDDELAMHRAAVARFVETEMLPHDARWRAEHNVGHGIWRKAGALGLLCTDIPVAYGGAGGDFRHEVVLYEELARRGITGFGQGVHSIAAHYLLNHGTAAQKARYLPLMARGELVGAIGMTEPVAGSDLQGIRTRAQRVGEEYVVNGSKIFITNGYLAELVMLVVKTDPGLGAKGTSILIVETRDLPGYRVGRPLEKIGMHAQDTSELFFDQVRVPADRLLGGSEGRGFAQLMSDLPYERLIVAVQAAATMEGALAATTEYVKSRKAFGKALLEFQNTRFKLAEVATLTRVARTFIDSCIQQQLKGELDDATASMAKWWATDVAQQMLDECVQLHGGYGYMSEYLVARMYADARVTRIYGGTNEIMKELIARSF
ncbi:MAG: acyl-CoA dehydrogenase family protein [Proteobacteria bacterium]|nr:acyl-CoA dehydrogenase family protein [Pseudomonadota bacterium]